MSDTPTPLRAVSGTESGLGRPNTDLAYSGGLVSKIASEKTEYAVRYGDGTIGHECWSAAEAQAQVDYVTESGYAEDAGPMVIVTRKVIHTEWSE